MLFKGKYHVSRWRWGWQWGGDTRVRVVKAKYHVSRWGWEVDTRVRVVEVISL